MALNSLKITSVTLTQKSRVLISFQPVWTGTILDGVIKRGLTQVGTWTTSGSAVTTNYRSGDTSLQPIHQGGNPFTISSGSISKTVSVTRKTYTGLAALKVNRILRVADELELAGVRAGLSVARQLKATLPVTEQPQRLSAGTGGHDLRVYLSPEVRKPEEDHHIVDTTADFNTKLATILPNGARFYDVRTNTPVTYQSDGANWVLQPGAPLPSDWIGGPRIVHDQTTGKSFRLEVNPYQFITQISYPNTPPTWITPSGEITRLVENDLLSYQLEADDTDGDTLTFSLQGGTLPPGASLSSTGLITMPAVIGSGPEEAWLDIDPSTRVTSTPNGVIGQIVTIETGQQAYRSNAGQTGPITKDKQFVPVNGQVYTATYTIRKIAPDTVGVPSLFRPQFDVWNGSNPSSSSTVSAGVISGEGFSAANTAPSYADVDAIDTRAWELNKWYTIAVTWTASGSWDHARPRLRVNRNATGSFPSGGGTQSDARFEILTQNVIKGTAYNSYAFTAKVSDGINPAVTRNFSIALVSDNAQPVWITAGNLGSFQIGQSVNVALQATDPEGQPVTYTVLNPANLPPGITLSGSTLQGTTQSVASNTVYNWTVRASDGVKYSDQAFSLTVNVNQAPVWSTLPSLGQYTQGQAFSQTFLATDADGDTLTYTLTSGTVPLGLTFNPSYTLLSGTISMTATVQTYNFTLQVSDGQGHNVTRTFSIDVQPAPNQAPVWTTASGSIGTFQQSGSVSINLIATDYENDSLTYTLTSGSLPTGLTLNSSGLISGTISAAAAIQVYNFTVQVSDGQGHNVSRNFSLTVTTPPPSNDANGCPYNPPPVTVTASLSGSTVWGDNSYGYTDDSDIARAVVHAGLASPGQTVTVYKTYQGYKSNFPGSTANGVTSQSYGSGWCAITISL